MMQGKKNPACVTTLGFVAHGIVDTSARRSLSSSKSIAFPVLLSFLQRHPSAFHDLSDVEVEGTLASRAPFKELT
jgi:hypothetical protein